MNNQYSYFKILLACILFLNISYKGKAQSDEYIKEFVQKITPPSPTAYAFSTHGNLPLNGSSGGFSYNLPLYTITSGDIKLPISLNYFSNGVLVDQLSGATGINWNLSAGGVISRVMKDFPDELGNRFYPTSIDVATQDVMLKNLARNSSYDGEQDWFSFNVNGISGTFYFDQNLGLHLLSDADVSIAYELLSTTPVRLKFTITDDKGFRYIFGDTDAYIEKNTGLAECSPENFTYDSSWFLKEIISPKNNSITFAYTDNNFTYKTSYSSSITYTGICPNPGNIQTVTNPFVSTCLDSNTMQSKVLSSISFNNNSVMFDYNTQRLDGGGKSLKEIRILAGISLVKDIELTYNTPGPLTVPGNPFLNDGTLYYRTFLKDITIKGNAQSNEPEKYSFEYYNENLLPIRLSYSKDKFGFHNASTNNTAFSSSLLVSDIGIYLSSTVATANKEVNPNVVYYGMIKKIIYPTKGYTEITYEANADTRMVQSINETPYTININKSYCNGTPVSQSYQWVSDGTPIKIQANMTAIGTTCTTGSYKIQILKNNIEFFNIDIPYGTGYTTNTSLACTPGFNNYAPICATAGSTYKVIVTLTTGSAAGQIVLKYTQPVTTTVEQIYYGGGARIKSIVDINEGQGSNKRLYYYNKFSDYLANISTNSKSTAMLHFVEPQFYKPFSTFIMVCYSVNSNGDVLSATMPDALRFSINSGSSYALSRQPISYAAITTVLIKDGINYGATERVFTTSPDTPGQTILGSDIYDSPASNDSDYTKDKVAEENVYDQQNTIKTKKQYHYTLLSDNILMSTMVRRNYSSVGESDYLGNAGYPVPYFSNYSIWIYRNHYGVIKLDNVTEQTYFTTSIVERSVAKTYGIQPFYQLKSETTTNSLGQSTKVEYKYPSDLIGVEQTPYMQQMVTAYRISEPIITNTYNGNVKLVEQHVKYENSANTGNLLLPTEIHTLKGTGNINITTTTDRKLRFTRYDTTGNLLEYKTEDDIPVSIIWGYNLQYPIAKIENALYSQVSGYASTLQTSSNNGLLTASSFSGLRTALPNAMITSYTYKPLLGMSSASDTKGNTTTYTYDDNGALKFVKDKYNNILSESSYHFKP